MRLSCLALVFIVLPALGRAETPGEEKEKKDFQQVIREFEADAQKANPEKVMEARKKALAEHAIEVKANDEAIKAIMQYPPSAKADAAIEKIRGDLKQGQWERCENGSDTACAAYEGKLFGNPANPAPEEDEASVATHLPALPKPDKRK